MVARRWIDLILLAGSLLLYLLIAQTERHNTSQLLTFFLLLFAAYWFLLSAQTNEKIKWWAAIIFRLVFIFFVPLLSDDVYRFIWDGRLLAASISPFAQTPAQLMASGVLIPGITPELFHQLNSPEYFTVYPPVSQFVFWITAKLFPTSIAASIACMKVVVIAADVGALFVMRKLLTHYKLSRHYVLVYALNPLVVVELAGNLHFEAIMIFFIVLSIWWMVQSKMLAASFSFALAISTKLLPLILLPLLIYRLGLAKAGRFFGYTATFCLLVFAPLVSEEFVQGLTQGIGYYFKKFEFNASIYYLVREYGFWKYGYNIVQTVGWKLGLWCAMLIMVYSFLEREFQQEEQPLQGRSIWTSFVIVFLLYLLFTTTLHPWYTTSLVAFSVFVPWRFAVVWSFTIFLTYAGYTALGFQENQTVWIIEYGSLVLMIAYELYRWFQNRKLKSVTSLD